MRILNESKRDDLLLPYLTLLNEKGIKCSLGELKRFLLRHLAERGGFRNLSLGSNFYLAGVARYYFNGDLTLNKDLAIFKENPLAAEDTWDEEVCKRLNALILILRNSIIDSVGETFEQPEDFGTLPIAKLLRKYKKKIDTELGIVTTKKDKPVVELDRNERVGNGYSFEIIYSYQQATKYYKATDPGSWCITWGENHYNGYIKRLNIHYVIFIQDGYENVPRQKGPNWSYAKPQDEYGCSLIALLQSNVDGEPIYITSRWNHGKSWEGTCCEADHAFTKEEFFAKTGVTDADLQRIFQIWKQDKPKVGRTPKTAEKEERIKAIRGLKYVQMCINGGENPDSALIKIPSEITEPELKKAHVESCRKVLVGNGKPSKSIIQYKTTINETDYFVLCDQGKILFDTLIPSGFFRQWGWHPSYEYYSQNNDVVKNVILIRLDEKKLMLYNVRYHKFIEIDGIKVFKYFDNLSTWLSRNETALFYEIKMSNRQTALIDANTNVPLKLPNGQHWCEFVSCDKTSDTWGREVRPRTITSDNTHLCLTYDSAANEVYVYNTQTKKFTQIKTDDIMDSHGAPDKIRDIPHLTDIFGEGAFCISHGPSWSGIKVVYNAMGQRLKLGDYYFFGNIAYKKDGYFSIACYQETSANRTQNLLFYSTEHKSFVLNREGEELRLQGVDTPVYYDENIDVVYLHKPRDPDSDYWGDGNYRYYIFVCSAGVLLKNPTDGSDVFTLGYHGVGNSVNHCRRNGDSEQYKIEYKIGDEMYTENITGMIRGQEYFYPFKDGSAAVSVIGDNENNALDNTLNEMISVSYDEIKMMVNEVIKKIK